MSEDGKEFRRIKAKPRSKKLRPRIDLAAMVSVSFLLIVFFMVTKELARPTMMDFGWPEGCDDCSRGIRYDVDPNRIITLLLDGDNTVISYFGVLNAPNEPPKKLGYGREIRKELIAKNKMITEYMSGRNYNTHYAGAILLIKPSKKCNYGNLVDILDEMAINHITNYAIVNDFTPEEAKLLASK